MTTALLIIDMQHALCSGEDAAFGIDNVIEKINALSSRARASGTLVIVGLLTAAEDIQVRKRTPSSFHRTELHQLLKERGVAYLVICGLQTEFCVDTTVRQALPLGYEVTLVSDAHSTTDGALRAEQVIAHHNRTLRWMTSYGPRMEVKPAAEVTFEA
jgi:nicotinamidase-related amidase